MTAAAPHEGFGLLDMLAVAAYMAATAAIAWRATRQRGTADEFFLGGRSMPWFAVGLSIMATLMSTVSYLAVPGEMIKNGFTVFTSYLSAPFSMAVVLCLWVPFFMRLRVTSAYEYLEARFGYSARATAAVLFVLLRLGWMGVILYTSSMALDAMLEHNHQALDEAAEGAESPRHDYPTVELPAIRWNGQPVVVQRIYLWILLSGVFTSLYTAAGGIRAVIWTDVMQSGVMFGGTIITIGYVAATLGSGPIAWWQAASQAGHGHAKMQLFSLDPTTRMTVVTIALSSFFWTICTHGSDQIVTQRYFSTASLSAAQRSYFIAAIADVAVGVLLGLAGLGLLAFYLQYPQNLGGSIDLAKNADPVFPHFIAHQLPPGLGGVILSALFAAAMSSLSSGINSTTAVGLTDLGARCFAKHKAWWSSVRVARGTSLVAGSVATAFAFWVTFIARQETNQNIIDLMYKMFNMFLGPLAGLFFTGMFVARCTSRSAMPGVLSGLLISFVWCYWLEITGLVQALTADANGEGGLVLGNGKPLSISLAIAVPCCATVALSWLYSLVVDSGQRHAGADWTWLAVMRREPPRTEAAAEEA